MIFALHDGDGDCDDIGEDDGDAMMVMTRK